VPRRGQSAARLDGEGAALVRTPRSHSCPADMSGRFSAMQGTGAGARRRRMRPQGAGLLVLRQGHSAEKAGAAGTADSARGSASRLQRRARSCRQKDQHRQRKPQIAVAQSLTPMPKSTNSPNKRDDLDVLAALERKVLWLASWMIHNANHLRENDDGLKV